MKFRHQAFLLVTGVVLVSGLLPLPAQGQFFQQGPKLVGTGAIGAADQGSSVSLSSDGSTAIVGAPNDDGGAGAAWVYTRSNGVWSQQAKLIATDAIGQASQGASVSLSGDGNTAIIGGPDDSNPAGGAAWVWTRSRGVWSEQAKLVGTGTEICSPSPCTRAQGVTVALSGDGSTVIIGGQDGLGAAAWVFTRVSGVWSAHGELSGGGNEGDPSTGVALSSDGNTAIIGNAFVRIFFIGGFLRGEAWVYTRSNGVWSRQAELVDTSIPPDGLQGYSVSLSGDGNTAIVGAPFAGVFGEIVNGFPVSSQLRPPGAASVYTRSGEVWSQQAKLVGTGALAFCFDEISGTKTTGSCAEQGWSASLSSDGNTAIVGGPYDGSTNGTDGNLGLGAAWIFTRSGEVWSQQGSKLVGTGAIGESAQGFSVSLSGDGRTAIVGGAYDNSAAGATWVFAPFAGTPGKANCHGQSISTLAREFGGLNAAAAGAGFPSISALQNALMAYCEGSDQVASSSR
jgi:hypothetical protein